MAFIQRHIHDCMSVICYLAEAHFVERDDEGNIFDGWPIGYYDYEFPQHKTLQDRMNMISMILSSDNDICLLMKSAQAILCDSMDNKFHYHFGAWPEKAFVFQHEKLIFKTKNDENGFRYLHLADQIEMFLDNRDNN